MGGAGPPGRKKRRFLDSCQTSSLPFPGWKKPVQGRGFCRHGAIWELRMAGIWMVAPVAGRLDFSTGIRCPRRGKGDLGHRATFVTAIRASAFLCCGASSGPGAYLIFRAARRQVHSSGTCNTQASVLRRLPTGLRPGLLGSGPAPRRCPRAHLSSHCGPHLFPYKVDGGPSPAYWKISLCTFFGATPRG